MKIKWVRLVSEGGFSHGRTESRVEEVPNGTKLPEGAERVPDDTPVSDWRIDNGDSH